jgi:hypothetical protein
LTPTQFVWISYFLCVCYMSHPSHM